MKNINKQNLITIVAIIFAAVLIFFALNYSKKAPVKIDNVEDTITEEDSVNNVSVVDGKQIIEIRAKGGFHPVHSIAKANVPTVLRVDTNGTFDCSSIIRIPSMDISENLPMSGTTDIDIGTQKVATIQGTCGMGMYPFDIKFE
ncbi:MAG: cupredoxin domain-containing protein [bacterium]